MAVVRIQATKRWYTKANKAIKAGGGWKRLERELERARERPGLTAELQGDEAEVLVKALPGDKVANEALRLLRECEAREAARPSVRAIMAASRARRGL
jgi:hypothetical protein